MVYDRIIRDKNMFLNKDGMILKLSIYKKIMIIILSLLIPLSITFYFLINNSLENVNFAKTEAQGIEYLSKLEDLFNNIIAYKIMSLQKKDFSEFDNINVGMKNNLNELKKINDKYLLSLRFTDQDLEQRNRKGFNAKSLEQKINEQVLANIEQKKYPSQDAYNDIINHIKTMITHVGDMSNLILDPVLDTYYLTDVVLSALPEQQDKLQELVSFVNQIDFSKPLSFDDKLKIGIMLNYFKEVNLSHIAGSTATAIQENLGSFGINKSLQENLQKNFDKVNNTSIALIDKISKVENYNSTIINEINKLFETAIQVSFDYQKTSFNELNYLFNIRINYYINKIIKSFIFVFISLIICIVLSLFIMKSITESLIKICSNLSNSSKSIIDKSNHLKDLSGNISSSSSHQFSLVNNTFLSVQEMTKIIDVSNKITNESAEIIKTIIDSSESSKLFIKNMQLSMETISQSSLQLKEIEKIILSIEEKTKDIKEIVSKTELLSLNASIESARAGEYGKGFAVVAEEVGNLAKISGKSSNEIEDLLNQSREKVTNILTQTIEKIEEGKKRSNEVSNSFEKITNNIEKIDSKIRETLTSLKILLDGINQIFTSIGVIENLGKTNNDLANKSLSIAKDIENNGEEINSFATETNKIVHGK
jgi:methyl-accepting chemotaxis protein